MDDRETGSDSRFHGYLINNYPFRWVDTIGAEPTYLYLLLLVNHNHRMTGLAGTAAYPQRRKPRHCHAYHMYRRIT